MSAHSTSSRRSFLKGGAIAAAPLAVALPAAALAEDHRARVQHLQDEAEIRSLHQAWLRKIATSQNPSALFADRGAARLDPAVQGVSADHAGDQDQIDVAADGLRATGRFAVTVDLQTELPHAGTLAQMARLQGGGVVRQIETRTLHARYVKQAGAWAIEKMELRAI